MIIVLHSDIQADSLHEIVNFQRIAESFQIFCRDTHLGIDSFVGNINSAERIKGVPGYKQFVAKFFGVRDFGVRIERQSKALLTGFIN